MDRARVPSQIKDGPISFTILANGALLADVPGYHTAEFVYPVGYKVFGESLLKFSGTVVL